VFLQYFRAVAIYAGLGMPKMGQRTLDGLTGQQRMQLPSNSQLFVGTLASGQVPGSGPAVVDRLTLAHTCSPDHANT
jgi:hypothetical protein